LSARAVAAMSAVPTAATSISLSLRIIVLPS
jgi:hypothetical protein